MTLLPLRLFLGTYKGIEYYTLPSLPFHSFFKRHNFKRWEKTGAKLLLLVSSEAENCWHWPRKSNKEQEEFGEQLDLQTSEHCRINPMQNGNMIGRDGMTLLLEMKVLCIIKHL